MGGHRARCRARWGHELGSLSQVRIQASLKGPQYGLLIWSLTCFFLVWVAVEVWALLPRWYIRDKDSRLRDNTKGPRLPS